MQRNNLVAGQKEELFPLFMKLKKIHESKWKSKLRNHNPWYNTNAGSDAWNNAKRGKLGLERLRLLVADMQAIADDDTKKSILKRQGFSRKK